MKRILQSITLVGLMLSLNSCGLIGASVRSLGRVAQGLGDMASSSGS